MPGQRVFLSNDQLEDLRQLTSTEIIEKYGWNYQKISYHRRINKIVNFPRGKTSIPLSKDQLKDLEQLTSKEIEEKYEWGYPKISYYRKINKIVNFPRERKKSKLAHINTSDLREKSVNELMEKFNVCRSVIINTLRGRGLPAILWSERLNKQKAGVIERDKKIRDLIVQNRRLRLASVMPFLSDSEIARAMKISRERVRQLRNDLGIPYIGVGLGPMEDTQKL